MKQIFATWLLEKEQGESLFKIGARNRLVSYFHTIEKESELKHYIKEGKQDENCKIHIVRNT